MTEKTTIFESTRGFSNTNLDFLDILQMGLSPDGGLFVPKNLPKMDISELKNWENFSYAKRAVEILKKFQLGRMTEKELEDAAQRAYADNFHNEKIAPVSHLFENIFLLELFHGPTASFKDMALQLTPKLFSVAMHKDIAYNVSATQKKFLILVATSGDTGIAAVEGFRHEKNISVVVLFPENGVSAVQKQQMQTAEGENVKCVGINTDFDFCQTTVKEIFNDKNFLEKMEKQFQTQFSAANSMNWGRLLPQVVYYFSAYSDLVFSGKIDWGEKISVCIPCGNFGNILGAFMAKEMGLPIEKFIAASNENNVLAEFLQTGKYDLRKKKMILTDSPSIDILKSSNMERFLYWMSNGNTQLVKQCFEDLETKKFFEIPEEILKKIQENFVGETAKTEEMQETVKTFFQKTRKILDPHTAVAVCVAEKFPQEHPVLVASTAHFGKFLPALAKIFGIAKTHPMDIWEELQKKGGENTMHKNLEGLFQKEKRHTSILEPDKKNVEEMLENFLLFSEKIDTIA